MHYRIVFRPQARADILSIYDFVAASAGEVTAESVVSRIEAVCQNLSDFPFRGSHKQDLGIGTRTVSVMRRATIVYRIESDAVRIVRIFYAGRNYSAEDVGDD